MPNQSSVKKILVVEDDANLNRLISFNLLTQGYTVESVFNGLAAKDILSKEIFDVVILDIMLPGMDGFQLCEYIKKNPQAFKTFVVVVTARTQVGDKIYGNILGADYYLCKPFSVAMLLGIIDELMAVRDKEFVVTVKGGDKKW